MSLIDISRLPDGFAYRADFITPDEQRVLVAAIERVEFRTVEMRGVVARRRVAFFGASYASGEAAQGTIPEFLAAVRRTTAEWAGVHPEDFPMALINEYRPGAPIGWHRDAPQYGIIAGILLLSSCGLRFRPYRSPSAARDAHTRRKATHEITLEPRSGYLITGAARSEYEHSIPSTTALRYSITFRTLRR